MTGLTKKGFVSRAAATQACVELDPRGRFGPWSFNGYQSFV